MIRERWGDRCGRGQLRWMTEKCGDNGEVGDKGERVEVMRVRDQGRVAQKP